MEGFMADKWKIAFHRIFWAIVLLIGVIVPIVIMISSSKVSANIVSDSGNLDSYYDSLGESRVTLELTFDRKIYSCDVTIEFYDKNHLITDKVNETFYAYDDTTVSSSFYVDGEADSYAITDYNVTVSNNTGIIVYCIYMADIFSLAMFICALLLSCKVYDYYGNTIVVYAGWFHHYIKVNGVKTDEHNTLISFTPIYLSSTMDDGTHLEARISLTNRISLKINDKLYIRMK